MVVMKTSRKMGTGNLVDQELVDAYTAGEGASSIARRCGVSVWSVITRLRKAGVEIRTNQNERRMGNPTSTLTFLEVVDGVLLGDGSIDNKNIFHMSQTESRVGWIRLIADHLQQVGSESKTFSVAPRTRILEGRLIVEKPSVHLYTPAYVEMKAQRERWYPGGKKAVPQDLRLTPVAIMHWLCGDGTAHGTNGLNLHTNGFTETDVVFLIERLRVDMGIETTMCRTTRKGQFSIGIHRKDEAVKLRDLVLPLMPVCCMYKLDDVRPTMWTTRRLTLP